MRLNMLHYYQKIREETMKKDVKDVKDVFRPSHNPARAIYDAFQKEAEQRIHKHFKEWGAKEKNVVWQTARDYAQQYNLTIPTMKQVTIAESCAMGHIDYGAQWAYGVVKFMGA